MKNEINGAAQESLPGDKGENIVSSKKVEEDAAMLSSVSEKKIDRKIEPSRSEQINYNSEKLQTDDEYEIKRRKRIERMTGKLNAVLWTATPALYVILSHFFGGWGKWWLLFVSASAGSVIIDILKEINLGASKKKIRGHIIGLTWLVSVTAYFLLSFRFGWNMTWLVFIAATIVSILFGDGDNDENEEE